MTKIANRIVKCIKEGIEMKGNKKNHYTEIVKRGNELIMSLDKENIAVIGTHVVWINEINKLACCRIGEVFSHLGIGKEHQIQMPYYSRFAPFQRPMNF